MYKRQALIRALLKVLPIGILAFAAQLSSQLEAGVIVGALGRYTLVIMAGNLTQFFIVLPLFLLIRGLNPVSYTHLDVYKRQGAGLRQKAQ